MYSDVSSVALYTTDSVRHLFCTGQAVLSLQEHSFSLWLVLVSESIFLLCLAMMCLTLSVQLYDNLIVLCLRILLKGFPMGKFFVD